MTERAERSIAFDGDLLDVAHPLLSRPGGVLLDSNGPVTGFARYRIASDRPVRVLRVSGDEILDVRPREGHATRRRGDPLDALGDLLPRPDGTGPPRPETFLYVGYEALARFEDVPVDDPGLPEIVAWTVDRVLVHDRRDDRLTLVGTDAGGLDPEAVVDDLAATLAEGYDPGPLGPVEVTSTHDRAAYADAVEQVRDQVRAGEIFQANIAQRFEADLPGDPLDVYARLRETNPGPFNAYADIGELRIASSSPERLVSVDGERVRARPIAGTRPRDAPVDELVDDPKEAAEHAMIVDLYRNDVSKIAEPGSVRVDPYRLVERYARVQHLTSSVVGEPRDGIDPVDVLAATFPGGSITGAPKVRAMEIIQEVEPFARGPYTGSLGYVGPHGIDLNILIRTLAFHDGRVRMSAGGGVVDGSDPVAEHDESLAKAQALLDTLREAPHAPPVAYRGGSSWTLDRPDRQPGGRVFLVDNVDSFVHNLAHHLGCLGATVRVARHDAVTVEEIRDWEPTHVVLSPGPKGPADTGVCPRVVKAFDGTLPLLGVCLGHEVIADVHGGDVAPAGEIVHGKASTIVHDGASVLDGIPSPLAGARYHSLHVPEPPPGFEAIARTDDGLLMGMGRPQRRGREDHEPASRSEARLDAPTIGLAFHPESILTDHGAHILANFLAMG